MLCLVSRTKVKVGESYKEKYKIQVHAVSKKYIYTLNYYQVDSQESCQELLAMYILCCSYVFMLGRHKSLI